MSAAVRASLAAWRAFGVLWGLMASGLAYARAAAPLALYVVYIPAIAFLGITWSDGRGWGLVAGAAAFVFCMAALSDAGGGRGLSLETLRENVTTAAEESRRRIGAVRVRRRWALTCQSLGWETSGPAGPLRPALRHVEALGDRIRVAFRPRGNVDPDQWPQEVDRLRRELGMHSAHHVEHPREPGTILATFGREPLPDRVDARPAATDGADVRIDLGPKAGGGRAAWVLAETPGLLLTGSTGGGKGGTIRVILRDLLEAGVRARVIDPKGTGEYRWADEAGASIIHGLEEAVADLRFVVEEIRRRCELLYHQGADRIAALPEHLRPPLGVLVVDEAADLLMLRRVPTERAADDLRSEAGSLLSIVASQGRAAGIHPVVAIQRADAALLGPAGGFLRDNLAGRIGLGRLSGEGIDMMFGSGHRDLVVALTGRPGRALAMNLAAGETVPYSLQVGKLEAADLLPEGWTPDAPAVDAEAVAA